jgi:hypothetical protein
MPKVKLLWHAGPESPPRWGGLGRGEQLLKNEIKNENEYDKKRLT